VIYFFDSSALVKRYLQEKGSETVVACLNEADQVIVSSVSKLECFSTFRRLLRERIMTQYAYDQIKGELVVDFNEFVITPFGNIVEELSAELIGLRQLKTLDAIQLASALVHRDILDSFVVSDRKLKQAANTEGLKVLDPVDGKPPV